MGLGDSLLVRKWLCFNEAGAVIAPDGLRSEDDPPAVGTGFNEAGAVIAPDGENNLVALYGPLVASMRPGR